MSDFNDILKFEVEIYYRDQRAPSVGFIQFALGSFNADCPHKHII